MFEYYNPNPHGKKVGDCAVRAISKALGKDWEQTYIDLCICGYIYSDLPNSNDIWDKYLKRNGFKRHTISESCPECYTVVDFCEDHPKGVYILGTGSHVVAVCDGAYCDAWDSGDETPTYYYSKGE